MAIVWLGSGFGSDHRLTVLMVRSAEEWAYAAGSMFWLTRNRLPGSYSFLTRAKRS